MRRPLKTLFLMEDLCYGGTQKQNLALANGLDRSRFDPRILTFTGPTDLDGEAKVSPLHLGSGRKVNPFFFFKAGLEIRKIAPDILVLCTALPNIWGRLWGMALSVPVILGTCRGGGAPARQHEALLWRLATHIVCNSRALVESMKAKGAPVSRLTYIPNGVDCARFHPSERKAVAPLILCVARLAKDKDLTALLRAFEILAKKNPAPRLRIVGDGPEKEKLETVISAMPEEIGGRIELAGASADPAAHYREADIFALSSVREGQPNAILEAMASGLPVCATSVGGIPDLIDQDAGGLLSAPRDAESFAINLERLLGDAETRKRMGSRNRRRAEDNFSFTAMISSHERLFENLWQKSRAS